MMQIDGDNFLRKSDGALVTVLLVSHGIRWWERPLIDRYAITVSVRREEGLVRRAGGK